uniref:Uncharacterized protein n=1 Tax=Cyprinus carpio TaxID=7962 RepID=A0A8C1GRG0_CYPCA
MEVSIVLLLCVGATLAQDFMSPTLDILAEFKKIKTMEEKLNALNDEVRELRSKNEGTVKCMQGKKYTSKGAGDHGTTNDVKTKMNELIKQNEGNVTLLSQHLCHPLPAHSGLHTLIYKHIFLNTGDVHDANTGMVNHFIYCKVILNLYNTHEGSVFRVFSKDEVCVNLYPDFWLFDSDYHHSTFSGHLLYPM